MIDSFVYIYQEPKKKDGPILLLLHGTGADEQDLIPLKEDLDPEAGVLSVRGNINENGMNRFFRRVRPGVFDEENLIEETEKLNKFIHAAAEKYGFELDQLVALGYSNGANIAASLLFHYEDTFNKAMLLHPMVPLRKEKMPNLEGKQVFISAGKMDMIVPPEESEELSEKLQAAGAETELIWFHGGHAISYQEKQKMKAWYTDRHQ